MIRKLAFVLAMFMLCSVARFASERIDFGRDVLPILSENCFYCHGQDGSHREADLRLDQREAAIAGGAITPGDLEPIREPFSYSDPATLDNLDNEDYLAVWRFGPNDPLQWNDINDTRNNSNRLLIEADPSSPVPEPTSMVIALVLATFVGRSRRRLPSP